MRDFITGIFSLVLILTILMTILVGVTWLFDCKPNNMYLVWEFLGKSLIFWTIPFILFGNHKK